MASVYDFSWQSVRSHHMRDGSVGDLVTIADRVGDAAFMVHDSTANVCAFVDSMTVRAVVEESGLSPASKVRDTGLWDVLRKDQLTVRHDQMASSVAEMVVESGKQLATVVNDAGEPVGLFVVDSVVARVGKPRVLPRGIQGQVRDLFEAAAGPAAVLGLVEQAVPGFHNERLNQRAPDLWTCLGPPRHRLVARRCPLHTRAPVHALLID